MVWCLLTFQMDFKYWQIVLFHASMATGGYLYEPRRLHHQHDEEAPHNDPPPNTGRVGNINWCTCEHCTIFNQEMECKCCKEVPELQNKIEGINYDYHKRIKDNLLYNKLAYYIFSHFKGYSALPLHNVFKLSALTQMCCKCKCYIFRPTHDNL